MRRSLGATVLFCIQLSATSAWTAEAPVPSVDEASEALRKRLTEREDVLRPAVPFTIDLGGRPLTLGGELETEIVELRRSIIGGDVDEPNRRLLWQQLELEAFYSVGRELSFFAQVQLVIEEDLLSSSRDEVSGQWLQLGEMWVVSDDVAGSGLRLEAGRLHFEDERRWWWDDELDAVRASWGGETARIAFAFARELWPQRSDQSFIEPEHDRVSRWISQLSWQFRSDHALDLFALHQNDRSRTRSVGTVIDSAREDEPDSSLTWLGARLLGDFDLGAGGELGYWLDGATVHGREHWTEYEETSDDRSVVSAVTRRGVAGWAVEVGGCWLPRISWEPRAFASYALASSRFRQTGIQANEADLGGEERFGHYGILLEPELSNLQIWTAGIGLEVLKSSSLDLVYHDYRLRRSADELWDAELEAELTGDSRAVGREIDLVLALAEWERVELAVALSGFEPGKAFGAEQGRWSYGSSFEMSIAF